MLLEAIVAVIFVVGLMLLCVTVAITDGHRKNRAEMRKLEQLLESMLARFQSESGARR